ncbi:hypothetical protein Fuma_06258 [Fuerstiella marisgermanici]|uniref:Uncharacterized protein n=1 Tax=Fuerstiella marisgermanici TaxID=1891926 RepID=A0A1P8WRD4_9PLAN|nr:hypothetical protein Fuma_06258 [Fuerstiella marisgermanici]
MPYCTQSTGGNMPMGGSRDARPRMSGRGRSGKGGLSVFERLGGAATGTQQPVPQYNSQGHRLAVSVYGDPGDPDGENAAGAVHNSPRASRPSRNAPSRPYSSSAVHAMTSMPLAFARSIRSRAI